MVTMINCKGTPFEMGLAHGTYARQQILNLIELYSGFFKEWNGLEWEELKVLAKGYDKTLREKVMFLYEEMQGIAKGASVDVLDIILLNTRYEIGLAGAAAQKEKKHLEVIDGCTTFGYRNGDNQWVAQNYDWQSANLPNLVYLNLEPSDPQLPRMKVVAEAGVIGQVGFNDHGVSIVVNALHATNLDTSKVPCMVIRRAMLAQKSVKDALSVMEELGVSALSHILIADKDSQISIETSPMKPSYIQPQGGRLAHTNHCLAKPGGVDEVVSIEDSPFRLRRIDDLLETVKKPSFESFQSILSDKEGYPNSINRFNDTAHAGAKGSFQTCYSIIIDVKNRCGQVSFGNPTEPIYMIKMGFETPEEGIKYVNSI